LLKNIHKKFERESIEGTDIFCPWWVEARVCGSRLTSGKVVVQGVIVETQAGVSNILQLCKRQGLSFHLDFDTVQR
jgi:hypothetical protein